MLPGLLTNTNLWLGVLLCASLTTLILAIAGQCGRLRVHHWVGIHTKETTAHPRAFALAHRIAAPLQYAAALMLALAAGGVLVLPDRYSGLIALSALGASIVALGYGGLLGARAAYIWVQLNPDAISPTNPSSAGTSCAHCSPQEAPCSGSQRETPCSTE